MHFGDDNLRVLISGAASGLGLACATAFASRGADLFLIDCDGPALATAASQLGAKSRRCDCVSEHEVSLLAADLNRRFPAVDVLINAAGRGYVRSLAMMRMTQAALPMMRRPFARHFIFNVASIDGFAPSNGMFPYASSFKSFRRLSNALAAQVAGRDIDVVQFRPQMTNAPDVRRPQQDQPYRLLRIDENHSASRIIDHVAARWRGERTRGRGFARHVRRPPPPRSLSA